MSPFSAWLPARRDLVSDLVLNIVGEGVAGLRVGISALERALAVEGFDVMAQKGRVDGLGCLSTVRLRVSTEPLSSMGNGCDVLAYLDEDVPQLHPFRLARGSVLLCELSGISRLLPAMISVGVIAYPVPFTDLGRRFGKGFCGKGLIAVGVLTQLFGILPDTVRSLVNTEFRRRYFDAGVRYAEEHLVKRDVFGLAAPSFVRPRVMLNAHQAVLFGLGVTSCECGPACVPNLEQSPDQWVARHVNTARQLVSSLNNRRLPGVTVYRGPQGKSMAMLGADPVEATGDDAGHNPVVLVPADLSDAVRLMGIAEHLLHERGSEVWVLVDGMLAGREQSVPVEALKQITQEMQQSHRRGPASIDTLGPLRVERDGKPGADVGYVAWGAAQGVVREAVTLCRSFGMNVAALYPKVLRPIPVEELESFAASVQHLVVVEPTQAGNYSDLVNAWTKLQPSTIRPEPGEALTPMDIFMREGLGAWKQKKRRTLNETLRNEGRS